MNELEDFRDAGQLQQWLTTFAGLFLSEYSFIRLDGQVEFTD